MKICNLWHNHLFHPSVDNIDHINKKFFLPNFQMTPSLCDTCFLAKQKRLPFHKSIKSSLDCFD